MHSERGLLINGTWRLRGESMPASKNSGTFFKPNVVGLSDNRRAPTAGGLGPIAAITPLAADKVCECANGDVHGLAACASIRSVLPFGSIKHNGIGTGGY